MPFNLLESAVNTISDHRVLASVVTAASAVTAACQLSNYQRDKRIDGWAGKFDEGYRRNLEKLRQLQSTRVDVGWRPIGYRRWESAEVAFHGFEDLPATKRDYTRSPEFTCLGHQWRIVIYPGGDMRSKDGMVAAYLYNRSDKSTEIEYFFSVRGATGKEVVRDVFCGHNFSSRSGYGRSNFAKRSKIIVEALANGTLTIEVRMRKHDQTSTSLESEASSAPFVPTNPLNKNILKKFTDEESADVIFEVGSVSGGAQRANTRKRAKISPTMFHAHRLILQDGAPMLAELCNPVGGDLSTVQITDVKPDIFRHMLFYVYGGKLSDDDLKANAKDLIDAADKYGVVSLKLEAEAFYVKSNNLTVDNILDNLLYAHSKNCALLQEAAIDFIVENGDEIAGTVSFQDVPGAMMSDLLTAMKRGKKKDDGGNDGPGELSTMRVGTLRKMLHEKGLDVDGSREAMIALLKENS